MSEETPEPPAPYATWQQLQVYWGRSLSTDEQARATDLLVRAARRINELPGSESFDPGTCEDISLDMVKRAMLSRGDGVTEVSASMADMSGTQRFINPAGNLYITSQERARLAGNPPAAFSLMPTSNARVPMNPWTYQQSSQTED
ncbi:hypothetical protein B1R94_25980 [Mycolicibacterium litorale]|nr:hypothetical protein B1R94_25980 [Mycolicibacterium litorale]